MAKLDYFLICENIVVDNSGKMTLVGIYDTVTPPSYPVTLPKVAVAFGVYPDKEDVKEGRMSFRMEVVGPNGDVAVSAEGEGEVKPGTVAKHRRVTAGVDLSAQLLLEEAGTHTIKLYINGSHLAGIPLEAQKA